MHAGGLKLAIWEDSCELEVWRNEFLQARHDSVEGVSTPGYFTKKERRGSDAYTIASWKKFAIAFQTQSSYIMTLADKEIRTCIIFYIVL